MIEIQSKQVTAGMVLVLFIVISVLVSWNVYVNSEASKKSYIEINAKLANMKSPVVLKAAKDAMADKKISVGESWALLNQIEAEHAAEARKNLVNAAKE